jgi:hypothetical protein
LSIVKLNEPDSDLLNKQDQNGLRGHSLGLIDLTPFTSKGQIPLILPKPFREKIVGLEEKIRVLIYSENPIYRYG